MEKEIMKDHKHVGLVTFSNIPRQIFREMAKHLDNPGEANWEYLAEWFGFQSHEIQVISFVYSIVI